MPILMVDSVSQHLALFCQLREVEREREREKIQSLYKE